jgi:hypothetical protein
MTDDFPTPGQLKVRGIDSNTLLRMYDAAKERSDRSPSQLERERATRAVQRIVRELERRDVRP